MVEQYLQTALEFFKEIWFQLNSRFGLEDTEAFKFLKPYLIQLQDNPLYMGISLAALFLVPYGLIKIRSISRERVHKLDELMEEMEEEEEYDEVDPRSLRRPEPGQEDDTAKPLLAENEVTPPTYMKVLDDIKKKDIAEEDFEAELEEFKHEPSEPSSDGEEIIDLEKSVEPISSLLTENEFDKELNEFMPEEPDREKQENDIASELGLDDSSHDEAIKELQEEEELMKLDGDLSADDPFSNYSELDGDEQDKASDEDFSPEEEYFLEDSPEKAPVADSPDSQSEAPPLSEESSDTPISELSDSEILASLETELDTSGLEPETGPKGIPEGNDYETEPEVSSEAFTFVPESDISSNELDSEPKVTSEDFTFEAESIELEDTPEPELDTGRPSLPMEPEREYSSPEKTDSLIDRLKFLQTRFENRYQPLETMGSPVPIEKKISDYASESLPEPRRYTSTSAGVSPDSKKYMDLLESFIFIKDQKKHK